ncbi:MAG: tripartite tricarboxylate transporter substrate binding protein [Proteobacteria bacterium]|nr:tripartite tricarboxylate transporter substrate binding protein [Pseudomonadota bacterium]
MNKREFMLAGAAILASASVRANGAWPAKPVRLVVPFPAGGAADVQARLIAARLSARLNQPVYIDNKGGAGGNIGSLAVARSPADGYTLLLGTPGPMAINKYLYRDMQYDPDSDFVPVSFISRITNVLVVNSKLPINDPVEFLKAAREAKEPLAVGIPGKGSAAHLAVVSLEELANVKFNQIFYKGSAPAIQDLIGGTIPFMISEMPSVTPHVKSGQLRALAVTSGEKWALTPTLPTLATYVPGFESIGWFVVVAPKGVPASIVAILRDAIDKTLAEPEIVSRFNSLGAVPAGGSPEAYIRRESSKWKRVIAAAKIEPD